MLLPLAGNETRGGQRDGVRHDTVPTPEPTAPTPNGSARRRCCHYGDVYRFLVTPRWLGFAALILVLATIMAGLGDWQLHRYRLRSSINARIDAAGHATPTPVADVLRPGVSAPKSVRYTRVTATGHYDSTHEILVRGRTFNGHVGFEVVTPLLLGDGTALLVDRGWVPPAPTSAAAEPTVPAAPTGVVTVTGPVRLPEHPNSKISRRGSRHEVRAISPAQLAGVLPYPVLGGYVTATEDGLVPVPIDRENALMNAGYVVQWWAFALLAIIGFGYLARREARELDPGEDRVEALSAAT
jgi:cytochrome oxidase assembly protein ShyY1